MLKRILLKLFLKFLAHASVVDYLSNIRRKNTVKLPNLPNIENPYFSVEVGDESVAERDDIVFISSRFRSGSTVFWNLFRQLDGYTAYYEPFNERKWFDPDLRGERVDSTHRGVATYWDEYDGLEILGNFYNEDWIREQLLMDGKSWNPQMKRFIETMIEQSKGRPVLQFNRIDFRLPWLRQHFPNATFLHLYRHPRDQWCSFLTDKKLMNKNDVERTYVDGFYLDVWCEDLKKHFPFLSKDVTPHPYQRFYYLWKLSLIYGKEFSDLSICYEDMTNDPINYLKPMASLLNLNQGDLEKACKVIQPAQLNKWEKYAGSDWFEFHESACEDVLNTFLALRH